MLNAYRGNDDARLKAPSTNLEWNIKKVTGEFQGEALDGATFAQRTKTDLELIAGALAHGAAGQAYAARAAGEVLGVFGVGGSAAKFEQPAVVNAPVAQVETPSASTPAPAAAPAGGNVDVSALLKGKADQADEKLAWKTSVVDLLKLLGKDSSQSARRRYAVALGFPEGEIGKMPSEEFNTWLHGQLMTTLASNGGNLPSNIA